MVTEQTNRRNLCFRNGQGRSSPRFSQKQSGLISGFPRKSKKGGIFKKLGLAGEVKSNHEEMVCEIEEASMKKSKLPKRNFKNTNGVVHASVPRKLRSAMKKRKLDSVSRASLASKKLNMFKTGVGSQKDFVKKEKSEMECKVIAEPITKDEEEVVETLYALARMFPGTDSADTIGRLDDALPDENEAKPETIKDSSVVAKAELAMADSREAPVPVPSQIGEMPRIQAGNFYGSEGTLDFLGRLKQSSVHVTESPQKIIDIALSMKAVEEKLATSDVDCKSSGLALWPGLSSTANPGAHVLPKQSAVKVPPWMGGSAASASPSSSPSPSKIASIRGDPSGVQQKELKRCASHIHISRLIRVLQTSSSPLTFQQNESRLTKEVSVRDLSSVTNRSEKAVLAGDALNPRRYPNFSLLDKCRTQNYMTQLAFELEGLQPSRNQSYDFLSLSPALDSNITAKDARNVSASTSTIQSPFPLSNPIQQRHHHPSRTFSMSQPETCHIPSAYNNRHPAASASHQGQPHQLSPYLPGPFAAAYQHQQFWSAAWYRAEAGNSTPLNQYAVSGNGKSNHHTLNPSHQTNSVVALHAAYSYVSQQEQQRLMAAAMSVNHHHHHSSREMKRQEQHFPFVYENTRTPLQLLCNDLS